MLNPSPRFFKSMESAQLGMNWNQLWATWPDILKESVALAILQSRVTRRHFPPVVEAVMARRTTSQGSRPIRRVFAFALPDLGLFLAVEPVRTGLMISKCDESLGMEQSVSIWELPLHHIIDIITPYEYVFFDLTKARSKRGQRSRQRPIDFNRG